MPIFISCGYVPLNMAHRQNGGGGGAGLDYFANKLETTNVFKNYVENPMILK